MIGQVSSDSDIVLYLTGEEAEKISKETVQGTLVRIDNPKRQGIVQIVVDEPRSRGRDYGIRVELDLANTNAEIFMGKEFYNDFLKNGRTGTRYGVAGSKVSILDISKCDSRLDRTHAEYLEFYRDNRENLRL